MLWFSWFAGTAAEVILVVTSLWVNTLYLPFLAWGLQIALFLLIKNNRRSRVPYCYLLPFVMSRVLFWTGVGIAVFNFLTADFMSGYKLLPGNINPETPFLVPLLACPITLAIAGWGYFHRHAISFCRDCRLRHGSPAERGFLGVLFTQEGHYQVGMLCIVSFIFNTVCWGYFFLFYDNSEFINQDRFAFVYGPSLLWVASLIYLAARYLGIWGYYCQNVEGSLIRQGSSTRIRFIMICDDRVALTIPETAIDRAIYPDSKYDTPISAFIYKRERMPLHTAAQYFDDLSGLKNVDVRPMYANLDGNADCNIFHFLCYLTPEQRTTFDDSHPDCQWYSLHELADLINNHQVAPLFAAEVIRLHTIATTWKTYTLDGRRRYKIKNYKPTFRIADIKDWDVDYNDSRWLYVAENNQDTPFYRLRKFWRRYVNGVGQ